MDTVCSLGTASVANFASGITPGTGARVLGITPGTWGLRTPPTVAEDLVEALDSFSGKLSDISSRF